MSTIPDYNTNPGAFVGWLDGQALDALPGNKNPKLTELVELLKGKITISTDLPTPLTKEQLEKLLAAYLTDPASINGVWAMGQFQGGQDAAIAAINGMIERGAKQTPPVTHWTVPEFMLLSLSALTMDRIDDDLITTFTGVMAFQDNQRKGLREELAEMTAELKIYGVIQSEINKVLSAASSQTFNTNFNLLDYKLYGYESLAEFMDGSEYKLLSKMFTDGSVQKAQQEFTNAKNELEKVTSASLDPKTLGEAKADYERKKANFEKIVATQVITVKTFLESDQKKSGAMKNIEASYSYDKDNNKLGNFSTSVRDRSRPLSDQVSEKTTRLNDVSSRYNAAIEALNRFIQKYDSIMRDILGAI
ncbi:virulence-associated V antigen [Aeromonas hydrophila]|uniref:virulence-associated V antigen n=1 Tax=Aeromonas hydrophila TaxID=644 RepID=UPI00235F2BE6|nr:virulence-associated V antigen [Aeromonas hydrophila]WDA26926.1 virulence-associated V antigen [Aeromonas hydrophila]WES91713.1 virulence-associated V antigen [Aeromonas hydrophila]